MHYIWWRGSSSYEEYNTGAFYLSERIINKSRKDSSTPARLIPFV